MDQREIASFCTACGEALSASFAFCPSCGTKVNDTKALVPTPKVDDLHIAFLLDRTGSMAPIAEVTCQTFNEFIASQRALPAKTLMTLVQFDSQSTDVLYDAVDISEVEDRTKRNYLPRGMTPLYDAVGELLMVTERADWQGKVLVVIQTDGQENSSVEWTVERVKAEIERLKAKGWEFMFLGAGLANWVGTAMGINAASVMTYGATAQGVQTASRTYGQTTSDWRSGARASAAFTDAEREEAERTKTPT